MRINNFCQYTNQDIRDKITFPKVAVLSRNEIQASLTSAIIIIVTLLSNPKDE